MKPPLRSNRTNASALINKGVALDRLERFEEALVCLDRAVALKPDDAELAVNRDLLVQRLKEIASATAPEVEPSVENA